MLATFLTSLALALGVFASPRQQPTTVTALTSYRGSPIQITAVKYKGEPVSIAGETFDAAEGWLEDVSVEVKNVSTENIVGLSVFIEFPPSQPDGVPPMAGLTWYVGKRYEMDREGGSGNLLLAPGESTEVGLAEWNKPSYRSGLQKSTVPMAVWHKVRIRPFYAGFTPDRIWAGSAYFERDPNNPNRFVNPAISRQLVTRRLDLDKRLSVTPSDGVEAPIAITGFEVDGRQFQAGDAVEVSPNFIARLKITFRNTSDQPITCVRFTLQAPDSRVGVPVTGPGADTRLPGGPPSNWSLAPGETATWTLQSRDYDSLNMAAQRFKWDDLSTLELNVERVILADGSVWHQGYILRLDPTLPGNRYRPVLGNSHTWLHKF
jgi:hypothetical protein